MKEKYDYVVGNNLISSLSFFPLKFLMYKLKESYSHIDVSHLKLKAEICCSVQNSIIIDFYFYFFIFGINGFSCTDTHFRIIIFVFHNILLPILIRFSVLQTIITIIIFVCKLILIPAEFFSFYFVPFASAHCYLIFKLLLHVLSWFYYQLLVPYFVFG